MSHRTDDAAPAHRPADEQARFVAALTEMFERRIRFNEVLGLRVESIAPPAPSLRFDMRPELIGHFLYGRLHGGVISAVLDATAGLALMAAIGDRHPGDTGEQVLQRFSRMGTIDLRVDFLRQGVGRHFVASAEVTRLGGRVGSTQMRLVNEDGVLIATGAASYILA
jgi:uncharacterized protein (TIGR00369 family)